MADECFHPDLDAASPEVHLMDSYWFVAYGTSDHSGSVTAVLWNTSTACEVTCDKTPLVHPSASEPFWAVKFEFASSGAVPNDPCEIHLQIGGENVTFLPFTFVEELKIANKVIHPRSGGTINKSFFVTYGEHESASLGAHAVSLWEGETSRGLTLTKISDPPEWIYKVRNVQGDAVTGVTLKVAGHPALDEVTNLTLEE